MRREEEGRARQPASLLTAPSSRGQPGRATLETGQRRCIRRNYRSWEYQRQVCVSKLSAAPLLSRLYVLGGSQAATGVPSWCQTWQQVYILGLQGRLQANFILSLLSSKLFILKDDLEVKSRQTLNCLAVSSAQVIPEVFLKGLALRQAHSFRSHETNFQSLWLQLMSKRWSRCTLRARETEERCERTGRASRHSLRIST